MAQVINVLLQNIYNQLAQMGKSITDLQKSLDNLNENLNTKIQKVVDTIVSMKENNDKESQAFELVLKRSTGDFVKEVKKLQNKVGFSDLEEISTKLKQISESSEVTLKPETIDVLLNEVLVGIKSLTGTAEQTKTDKQTKGTE